MTKPYISIIIPAHNESTDISKTIESMLFQNYVSYEIVVACNGCTDDTAEIARNYGGVKVVESEKSGMSWGKNFGAQNAEGDLFVFVDADTQMPANGLQTIEKEIGNSPAIIGTMGGAPDRGGLVVR